MTTEAQCEHCGDWMCGVYVKTSVYYTWVPDKGRYLNTEQNWDSFGDISAVCPSCNKITDSVVFTDDGRLIPAPTQKTGP